MNFSPILATSIVGLAFLFAGFAKLWAPHHFAKYLFGFNLDFLSRRPYWLLWFSHGLGFFESLLGTILLFRLFPDQVYPLTIVLLVLANMVMLWAHTTRKIEACACYGPKLKIGARQGTLLSIGYILLIAYAWHSPDPMALAHGTQTQILMLSVLFCLITATAVVWLRNARGDGENAYFTIKPGDKWNQLWLDGYSKSIMGHEQIIVFIHEDCQKCKSWMGILNKIAMRKDTPQLIGAFAGEANEIDPFRSNFNPQFPVLPIKLSTVERIIQVYPTICVVRNGTIISVDAGKFPPEIIETLSRATNAGITASNAQTSQAVSESKTGGSNG